MPTDKRPPASSETIIDALIDLYPRLSATLRRPAKYIIDNPGEIGVNSMRQLARLAESTPNALVRLAKALGFNGFAELQEPFRAAIRSANHSIPDRARWLQSLGRGGSDAILLSQMAGASLANVEHLFSGISPEQVTAAARALMTARTAYVMGVRGAYSLAHNFYYVARMALANLTLTPRQASSALDDLIGIEASDAVLAISLSPYAADSVEAAHYAKQRGATLIAVTDSRASPLARIADHLFLAPSSTPQFFNSIVASAAMLEVLMAFIVARGDDRVLASIRLHDRVRHEHGAYWHNRDT